MPARLDDLAASFRRDLRAEGRSERTAVVYGAPARERVVICEEVFELAAPLPYIATVL